MDPMRLPRDRGGLPLGNHALTGEKLKIPFDELKRHWHVMGKTGKGKSKALEIFCRHIIDGNHALVVLDGKEDLFEAVRDYCALREDPLRVVVVDPTDQRWAVGINYLEVLGETDPAVLSEMVMEGLKKCFGESDEFKPLLEEWNPASILPLIRAGMSLAELEEFASIQNPKLRRSIFEKLGGELEKVARKWEELRAYGPHEAAIRTAVVRTRAALITQSPMAEVIFGQVRTTIDWRKMLDEGGVVLIRAHPHEKITKRLRTLLGTTVLHQLMMAARSRPKGERRDAWVVCDEFQQFACPDFVEALTQMRSFHLWFVLSHQSLDQPEFDQVPGLRELLPDQCTGKLYFSISRADSERVVHELFQEDLHGNLIKDEIKQTKFRPVESRREVITETETHAESNADTCMDVTAGGDFVGTTAGFHQEYGPGWVILPMPWERTGSGWNTADIHQHSSIQSQSRGQTTGTTDGHATARSLAPWYEYHEFTELSSRTYYSLEEITNRAITWLMCQHDRKAMLKIGDRKTLPVLTRYLEDVPVLDEEIAEFLAQVLPRCARPTDEVRAEIRARVKAFIEQHEREQLAKVEEQQRLAAPKEDFREELLNIQPPERMPRKRKAED